MSIYKKTEYSHELTKEAKQQHNFSIKIEKKISLEDIENIIVTAIEGGINYWAGIDNSLSEWNEKPKNMPLSCYAVELLISHKSIKFYDIEETDDDTSWILTLDKLLNGIKLNAENRPFDSDLDNMDSNTADCIIQYALFDNIIYG